MGTTRLQQQPADWSLRRCADDDGESRKELRVWMRRKQRERLTAYQRQREELRQLERQPFASGKALNSTFTYQAAVKKIKEDKDKYVPAFNVDRQWGVCGALMACPQRTAI
ncbi:hypothetical protein N1851_007340 [Merluccius polli]|uniref:Uncharacterized protein n=1 Tax=Merluccius polli TaxID=89951 RepID=A0AA47N4A6_MERPO|nr:hypothetical protein N1851_007340 [Merluccius polli]